MYIQDGVVRPVDSNDLNSDFYKNKNNNINEYNINNNNNNNNDDNSSQLKALVYYGIEADDA